MSTSSLVNPVPSNPPQAEAPSSATNTVAPNPLPVTANVSPYSSWITNTRLNVKSHDKRLNQDPQALQQFLLTHASGRPTVLIECVGTHEKTECSGPYGDTKTTTVTDFHFTVDVSSALLPANTYGAPVWVVADEEPAKRGRYWRQIECNPNQPQTPANLEAGTSQPLRRAATPLEKKQALDYDHRMKAQGLPLWALRSSGTSTPAHLLFPGDCLRFQDISYTSPMPPFRTLAEWAEEYCASRSPLKEFRFSRTVYGWDLDEVQRTIKAAVAACHSGDRKKETVKIIFKGRKVIVRPNNPLWWLYGLGFFKFFLCITLIYPLIMWPIKRYLLGRCWKVAGSSFAFVRYEHLEDSKPGETIAQYIARVPQPPPENDLKATTRGISKIVGQHFVDWFSANKQSITNAAVSKTPSSGRNPIVI